MATPNPFAPLEANDPFAPVKDEDEPAIAPDILSLVEHGKMNLDTGQGFQDQSGWHTILSISVQDERLNGGKPTVIPSVYEGKQVTPQEAIRRAFLSQKAWPSAETEQEATQISVAASQAMNRYLPYGLFAPVENSDSSLDISPGMSTAELMDKVFIPGNPYRAAFDKMQEEFVKAGQFVHKGLYESPDLRGKLVAQFLEENVRWPSSLLEQIGTLYSDLTNTEEGNNALYLMGRTLRESTRTPEEEIAQEGLVDEFTRGLAQTVGILLGGKAAATVLNWGTKGAGALAAWLGAAVGGQAGREDAIQHGAEDWQVKIAYYMDSVIGTSEGGPLGLALGRVDDFTGGAISKRIKGTAGKIAIAGLHGLIEEGLQESVQTFGENYTAAEIAAYDPGRPLSAGMLRAGEVGGSIGLLVNLTAAAFGARNHARFLKDIKENVLDPLGIDDLKEVSKALQSIDDAYAKLEKRMGQQSAVIEERSKEDKGLREEMEEVKEEAEMTSGKDLSRITPEGSAIQSKEDLGQKKAVARAAVLSTIKTNKELEGEEPLLERAKKTPVVLALTHERAVLEEVLTPPIQKKLDALKEKEKTGELTTEEKKEKEDSELILKQHRAIVREEKKLAKALKSLTASLMHVLPKGSRVAVTNSYLPKINTRKSIQGAYDRIILPDGQELELINLKTGDFAAAVARLEANPDDSMAKQNLENAKVHLLGTYLHEFGHAVGYLNFQEMYHKIERGEATEDEKKVWNGLVNDYLSTVGQGLQTDARAVYSEFFSLPRASKWMEALEYSSKGQPLTSTFSTIMEESSFSLLAPDKLNLNYIFSMREYLAEEFAKLALGVEGLTNAAANPFFEKGVESIKKALAQSRGKFGSTSPTMVAYFRRHSLRRQIASAVENIQKNTEQNPLMALAKAGIGDLATMKKLSEQGDRFNKFMDIGFNILQIAELNRHIQGLQNYVAHLRAWKNEVNNNLAIAEDRLTEWKNLGKEENEKLARLLLDETVGRKPDGGWLANPRPFTLEEIAAYKLSDEALELRKKIKEDFRNSLSQMEEVLIAAKRKLFSAEPAVMQKEILKVQKEFKEMKDRPYFPLMRFGEFILQVRSKGSQLIEGKNYKDGEIVEFQSFDTRRERDRAVEQMKKHFLADQVGVSSSKMITPNFSLQGMPLTLLEHLESKLVSTGITEEVRKAIQEVKNDVLPFKSFRKQFQRRKRIQGYSLDAQRAYANYMTSFSNHIARVKFDSLFKDDFENVANSIKAINRRDGGDSTKRAEILNHMNDHLNYVMNPVNEFVSVRSAAFSWFLGFNLKSAFVNMIQVPAVTYPYLAARFGDGRAVAQLTRANELAIKALVKPSSVSEGLRKLIGQGINESWLDESLATELALAASEKNLDKSLPRKVRQKVALKISQWGSLPFHTVEKFNRHVTAIASYNLAIADKMSHEEAVEEARRAVEKTQFEYARWARPRFMRGKVGGTLFVFMNYTQNALYFALGGDPGAMRMLVMLFMLGGLMGLPFGENIMDLVDGAMTALKRRTGAKNPLVQTRVELRKLLKELEINPDLVLHGLSSSTFGFANIGEFMGWPIPDVDISGSLSMGRIIPGTEMLEPGRTQTFEQFASQSVTRGGGAAVSAAAGIAQALFDSHPDQWKRWEKAMPSVMQQISKAARYKIRGEEATRSGYPIAGFDMHDPQDQGEIIAQLFGFPPREVRKGWESFIAQQQAVIYYETWKSSLLRQWNFAREKNDEEAVKEANAEIREYNSVVPFPEMKIGPKTRRKSYESYLNTRKFNARKIEQSKPFRRLSSSIEAVFEEGNNSDTP